MKVRLRWVELFMSALLQESGFKPGDIRTVFDHRATAKGIRDRAVTDDWFQEFYSQLAYGSEFLIMLDCCHSGGMTRAGLGRPRAISPPDDVRHRELEWNPGRAMWVPRGAGIPNRSLRQGPDGKDYLGESGMNRRFGRARR